jgi:phage-related protein
VLEVALLYKSNAFRVVYTVQLGEDLWVVHAFQKKSTTRIKTSKRDLDLVRERLRRLREVLK